MNQPLQLNVPADLLQRYGTAAPRYTSYPTAVDWKDNLNAAEYPERLARVAKSNDPLSVYVHIPFCEARCFFCGCNVVITKNHQKSNPYIDSLEREFAAVKSTGIANRPVRQYHWGGGTPTFLSEDEMRRLHDIFRNTFRFAEDSEVAIEVDPRHTTPGQVKLLAEMGFNRVSMGVQDFDEKVQEAVHRIQSEAQTRSIVECARDAGIRSINIDLIYGLPYQTLDGFKVTLERVLDIRPERVALYHYAHVPWIRKHQNALPDEAFPDSTVRMNIFTYAVAAFTAAGYEYIGFDHFALPDDELAVARRGGFLQRNFMGYSTRRGTDLIPFGVSSIGEIDGAFVQNPHEVDPWTKRANETGFAVYRGHVLDREDRLRREVILSLMCNNRIDKRAIERDWQIDFDSYFARELGELEGPERDGLVVRGKDTVDSTPLGQVFLRNLALPFDTYYRKRQEAGSGTGRTFSRTV